MVEYFILKSQLPRIRNRLEIMIFPKLIRLPLVETERLVSKDKVISCKFIGRNFSCCFGIYFWNALTFESSTGDNICEIISQKIIIGIMTVIVYSHGCGTI